MGQFFKFMFASMVGFIFALVLIVLLGIGMISLMASSFSDEKEVTINKNSVLELRLNYMIPERSSGNPFEKIELPSFESGKTIGLNDILKNIKKAAEDEDIRGIFINTGICPNSYATIEEIRNELVKFKKSKKFVIAYSELMDEHGYYLASVADKIYINPSGELLLNGFSNDVAYIKGMLDKLGLNPELIRHGKYKAAGEFLIADKMSDENRAQISAYMGSLYNHFIDNIAFARKKPAAEVHEVVEKLLIQNPEDAVTHKMTDGSRYFDEVETEMKTRLGVEEKDKIAFVSMAKYKNVSEKHISTSSNKVAVVYCVGDIVSGKGENNSIGSDKFAETIRKIRKDSTYKALVLRINSPGGSALASDVIWREVVLTKKVKPVVVSMGSVAASGGYFIAAPADMIIAEPNTITGSIGVFGLLMNAQKLLNDKLGIKIETVKFGEFADLGRPDRPLNEAERKVIQKAIDKVYVDFVQRVADGRHMTTEQVDSIAQGRVWSAKDAKNIGLIDAFGGLDDAIAYAVKKAGLDTYRTVSLPEIREPFEEFLKSLGEDAKAYFVKNELGDQYELYRNIQSAIKYQGIQARMPFDVEVQ